MILGIVAAFVLTLWQPRLAFALLKIAVVIAIAISFGFIGMILLSAWLGSRGKGKQ